MMESAAWYQALRDPASYPEPTTAVEVRETHISWVFLTDAHAYKIKKPVNLGFLDFSTLDQRRFYCEQELALNRRLSADVYLAVVPLYRDDQHYSFADRGQIVEYALKMRRLPDDRSLEALLRRGAVAPSTMHSLAQRLAAFHAGQPLPASVASDGTLEQARADWEENFAQTAPGVGQALSQQLYGRIQEAVTTFMARHAAWFEHRVRKELAGVTPETSQQAAYRAGVYSAAMTQRTYEALAEHARQALVQGHSVVLDASFAKRAERLRLEALARETGAECCVLECWAPEAVLRQRLRARERGPGTISDAREEILAPSQRDYEPVQADEAASHLRLDTTQPPEACVRQALAAIHEGRP